MVLLEVDNVSNTAFEKREVLYLEFLVLIATSLLLAVTRTSLSAEFFAIAQPKHVSNINKLFCLKPIISFISCLDILVCMNFNSFFFFFEYLTASYGLIYHV